MSITLFYVILIGIVFPLAIIGGIYLYNRYSRAEEKEDREEDKSEQNTLEYRSMAEKALDDSFARVQNSKIQFTSIDEPPIIELPKTERESVQITAKVTEKAKKPKKSKNTKESQ